MFLCAPSACLIIVCLSVSSAAACVPVHQKLGASLSKTNEHLVILSESSLCVKGVIGVFY